MSRATLLAGWLVLWPLVAEAQVPGMGFPADSYTASCPLSRMHVPLDERIAHGAGPDYPPHPSVHNFCCYFESMLQHAPYKNKPRIA
jgi:hypothetical protein